MPIFEYSCRKCSRRFEALVFGAETPECPHCRSRDLEKLFSTFALGGESAREVQPAPAEPCGTCGDPRGPGSCSMN